MWMLVITNQHPYHLYTLLLPTSLVMDWPGISNQVKQVIISSQELVAGLSAWKASPRQKEVADSKRSLKPFPSTNTTRAPIACLNAVWRRPWRSFSVFHGTFHKWQAWCLAGLVNKQQHLISSLFSDSSSKMARFNDVMVGVGSESCDCLPDCEATEYQYAVTSSSLRLRNTFECKSNMRHISKVLWLPQPEPGTTLHVGDWTLAQALAGGGGF